MAPQTALLAALGRLDPSVFDFIYPQWDGLLHDRIDRLPQLGSSAKVLAQTAHSTRTFTHALIQADLVGTDVSGALSDAIDEWCRTPWPRKWPRPHIPVELGSPDDTGKPQPQPWLVQQMRIVGALVLAEIGDRLGSDLGTALTDGAGRLTTVAVDERG